MAKQFGQLVQPSSRRSVAWYSPSVLLHAGRELLSSTDFQRNLDRRENFSAVDVIDLSALPANNTQPFWFDFISDVGDSGSATYSVARAALEPELHVANSPAKTLPTGQLLVLGGDLAYPGASPEEYQYRFLELYEMAKRHARVDTSEKVTVSIPQNHDWFDSLSTFCRYFVNRDSGEFIGAKTPQKQTYFAVKLPHNWWVLGFDYALGGDIDRNQFEAFRALLGTPTTAEVKATGTSTPTPQITTGAQLILLYPEPYWYRELGDAAPDGYPKRYQRLEYLLEQSGARIAMRLAGDQHHYSRDTLDKDPTTAQASHLITCGAGGAFMHPTHCRDTAASKLIDRQIDPAAISPELQHRIRVGRVADADVDTSAFNAARIRYPSVEKSRSLAWGNIGAMFKPQFSQPRPALGSGEFFAQWLDSNFGFALFLGLLYGFNAYVNSLVFSYSFIPDGFGPMANFGYVDAMLKWLHAMIFAPTALIINLVMLAGCVRIASEGPTAAWIKTTTGFLHGMAHGYLVFALYWLGCMLAAPLAAQHPFLASCCAWLFVTVCGVGVGGLLFGSYFAVASYFGQMPNNAFSAMAIQDYKGFLRFELTDDKLHAYFIARDHIDPNTRWESPPTGWKIKDQFDV
ncbi:MAG: hypothetical protein JWM78_2180 [Verrucomicrobiaceae bacterium]|nr:hypothetical protein [Verrucomicrobiaceae bacterium]